MSSVLLKNSILGGDITVPPSKSVSHRALICSFLANAGVVEPIIDSNDMRATQQVISAIREGREVLDCIESGSTMRFMIPVAAALGLNVTFAGQGSLLTRTLGAYLDLLPQHGVSVESNGYLPIKLSGRLQSGTFEIAGDVSSQYITGLHMALPLLDGDSKIVLTTVLQSKPYVDITLKVLSDFGIEVKETDYGYFVAGGQKYKPRDYRVESDWSQAAFFLAAGVLGGELMLHGLDPNSAQGDKEIVTVLKQFGGDIECRNGVYTAKKSALHGIDIDAENIPDLVPILAVVAAYADGDTTIFGAERLRYKESDRIESVCSNLVRMGAEVEQRPDGMVIHGRKRLKGGELVGFNDHRILMAFSVAALFADGDTTITDAESINKSYPDFFDDYNNLGGKASVLNNR